MGSTHYPAKRRWHRSVPLAALALFLFVVLGHEPWARAGGPSLVGGTLGVEGSPFRWNTGTATPVEYTTDQGGLGILTNAQVTTLVSSAFAVWQAVPTADITFQKTTAPADLGQDITGTNVATFLNSFDDCAQASSFTNAILFDSDGSMTDALLGAGSSTSVVGFAGPACFDGAGFFTRGKAVLNGRFLDGMARPADFSQNKYQEVGVHEFGHLIGLDHSQINVEVLAVAQRTTDNLFGLPVMFPFILGTTPARADQAGFPALAPDDEAWVSRLYPDSTFDANFGTLSGTILFSDGITHAQGVNVIARQVDDPGTPEDESRRIAVAVVSGYLFTGNPGQAITGTNDGGSSFGSRDPLFIGTFDLSVPPGEYTIEVESLNSAFVGGSGVGPLNPPIANPGAPEFWDLAESATDAPGDKSPVTVTAGGSVTVTIILNGTPPRRDEFESFHRGGPWGQEPELDAARREPRVGELVAG